MKLTDLPAKHQAQALRQLGAGASIQSAVASSELLAAVELAYREGYNEGYQQGGDDATSYEWGSGSKHDDTRKRDENQAWNSSEAKAANSKITPNSSAP